MRVNLRNRSPEHCRLVEIHLVAGAALWNQPTGEDFSPMQLPEFKAGEQECKILHPQRASGQLKRASAAPLAEVQPVIHLEEVRARFWPAFKTALPLPLGGRAFAITRSGPRDR